MNVHRLPWAAVLAVLFTAQMLTAEVLDKTKAIAGTTVHYKVILPQAEQRGYVVILPAAPDGRLFFEGSSRTGTCG